MRKQYSHGLAIVAVLLASSPAPATSLLEDRAAREDFIRVLQQLDVPSDPVLSPDQSRIAFTLTTGAKKDGERRRTQLIRIIDASGKGATTTLCEECSVPKWSADGRYIAHLAKVESKTALMLTDVATRASTKLFPPAQGREQDWMPTDFEWSPDGRTLAVVGAQPPYNDEGPVPAVLAVFDDFSPLVLHQNETTPKRIALIDAQSAKLRWLTDDTIRVGGGGGGVAFAWSADGKQIAFDARRNDGRGDVFQQDRIMTIPVDGSGPAQLWVETSQPQSHPFWMDERTVGFQTSYNSSSDRRDIVLARQGEPPRTLKLDADYFVSRATSPRAYATLGGLVQTIADRGSRRIAVLDEKHTQPRYLTAPDWSVTSYALTPKADRVAAVMSRADTPDEVYIGRIPAKGEVQWRRLTDFGQPVRAARLSEIRKVKWRSRDNRFDVEGFLFMPKDFSAQKKYPLLVVPNGGPSTYSNTYETIGAGGHGVWPGQLYAAMGYMVLLPGRRGDVGYGRVYNEAFIGRWGDDVVYDVEGGVDDLIARGWVDPQRVGIAGFSYGGYATAWAITQTDRYRAASFMDGPLNLPRFALLNSPEWDDFFGYFFGKKPVVNAMDDLWDRSPLRLVVNVKTPFMAMGANMPKGPFRWGLADDAIAYFAAAHLRGVPSQLFVFNREAHAINEPQAWFDYVDRNVHWFNHWLLGVGEIRTDMPVNAAKTSSVAP